MSYIDEAISYMGVNVLIGFLEMRVSHLADSVHWTGGHRQVSNMSDLRGSTLKNQGGKAVPLVSSCVATIPKCI